MEARRADGAAVEGAPGSGDERVLCALGGPARAHAWPVAAAVRPPALLSAQPSAEQEQQEVSKILKTNKNWSFFPGSLRSMDYSDKSTGFESE